MRYIKLFEDYAFEQHWEELLDAFWEEQIEKEPSIFMKLKVGGDSDTHTYKSNNISKSLYNKYKHLGRGKKTNLWELK